MDPGGVATRCPRVSRHNRQEKGKTPGHTWARCFASHDSGPAFGHQAAGRLEPLGSGHAPRRTRSPRGARRHVRPAEQCVSIACCCGAKPLTRDGGELMVAGTDVIGGAATGEYPVGRTTLPVKDVGRLLLRCADRPGLVAAVSAFLADAGANIVSLDQHSTQQTGGMFMQRTIFHLPGLTAARDELERDFAEQVAAPVRHGLPAHRGRQAQTGRHHGVERRPLPAGSAVAQPPWRIGHVGGDGDRQPSRPGRSGTPIRGAVHPRAGHQRDPRRSRTTPARLVARQRRPGGAGPLHADRHPAFPRPRSAAR